MRILVTGTSGITARRFVERMRLSEELLCLGPVDCGVPWADLPLDGGEALLRFIDGVDHLVHLAREYPSEPATHLALLRCAVLAGVRRAVVLTRAGAPGVEELEWALLSVERPPLLLSAGPLVGPTDPEGWGPGLLRGERLPEGWLDERDVVGALESALHRGRPGHRYALRGPGTGEDEAARAELGWWNRDPARSLEEAWAAAKRPAGR
jgi:uncharacterized protein YbjT (DUF2867 family)